MGNLAAYFASSPDFVPAGEPAPAANPVPVAAPVQTIGQMDPAARTALYRQGLAAAHPDQTNPDVMRELAIPGDLALQKGRADIQAAKRQGINVTPEYASALLSGAQQRAGLPSAEDKSREIMLQQAAKEGATDTGLESFGKGLRDSGLSTYQGVAAIGRGALGQGTPAQEQEDIALYRDVQAAEGASGARTAGSIVGGMVPLFAVPAAGAAGLATGRAVQMGVEAGGLVGTMTAPQMVDSNTAGVNPATAYAQALTGTAAMMAAGRVKTPTLIGDASKQALASTVGRTAVQGTGQGVLNVGAQQGIGRVAQMTDPSVQLPDANLGTEALIWGGLGGLGARGARQEAHQRNAENAMLARQGAAILDPETQAGMHSTGVEAVPIPVRMAEIDAAHNAARRQNVVRDSAALKYPLAEPTDLGDRISYDIGGVRALTPEVAGKEAEIPLARGRLAAGEAVRERNLSTAMQLLGEERAAQNAAELAAAHGDLTARQEVAPSVEDAYPERSATAEAIDTQRQAAGVASAKGVRARAEAGRIAADPRVRTAKENFVGVMANPAADRVAIDMAKQGLDEAVAAARAEPPAIEALPARAPEVVAERPLDTGMESRVEPPVEVGAERATPKLAPPSVGDQLAAVKARRLSGEISPAEAIAQAKAIRNQPVPEGTPNAIPPSSQVRQESLAPANEGRGGRNAGVRAGNRPIRLGEGSRSSGEEGQRQVAPRAGQEEIQGQDQGRGAPQSVEGRRDQVSQPGLTNAGEIRSDNGPVLEAGNVEKRGPSTRGEDIQRNAQTGQPESGVIRQEGKRTPLTRETMHAQVAALPVSKAHPGLADATMALIDARARTVGVSSDEWIATRIGEVRNVDEARSVNGSVRFARDAVATIKAFRGANASTVVHEVLHVFRQDLSPAENLTAAKWAGARVAADGSVQWTRPAEERFARAGERYLHTNKAPTPALVPVFERLASWMKNTYHALRGDVKMSPEVTGTFDRLFGSEAPKAEAPKAEAPKAEAPKAEAEAEGYVGKVQPFNVRSKGGQEVADAIVAKHNAKAEENRVTMAAAEQEAQKIAAVHTSGAEGAAADILNSHEIVSPAQFRVLHNALSSIGDRVYTSNSAKILSARIAARLASDLSASARLLSHAQVIGPEERRVAVLVSLTGPTRAQAEILGRLEQKASDTSKTTEQRAQARAEHYRITKTIADRAETLIRKVKDKTGLVLNQTDMKDPVAVSRALDAIDAVRGRGRDANALSGYLRASMLSDVIYTEGQQFSSNLASTLWLRVAHDPVRMLFGGKSLGALSSRWKMLWGNVQAEGWANAIDSYWGATKAERAAKGTWASRKAPHNVALDRALHAKLGGGDEPGATQAAPAGWLEPIHMISTRAMAFADGAANRINSRIIEGDLMYQEMRDGGATHAAAKEAQNQVLDGTVRVPAEMQREAAIQSLSATQQHLAVSRGGTESAHDFSVRKGVSSFINSVHRADKVIPLSTKNAYGEQYHLPVGTILAPFIRTPTAIAYSAAKAIPLSGAAILVTKALSGKYSKEWHNAATGETVDRSGVAKHDLAVDAAHFALGVLAQAAVALGISSGKIQITGTAESDTERRMQREGDIATAEYTLKMFGYDFGSISRIEPFATMMAAYGNAANSYHKDQSVGKALYRQGEALVRIGGALPMFAALSKVRDMVTSDAGIMAKFKPSWTDQIVKNLVAEPGAMFMPAMIKNYVNNPADKRIYPEVKGMAPADVTADEVERSVRQVVDFILKRSGVIASSTAYNVEGDTITTERNRLMGGALGPSVVPKETKFSRMVTEFPMGAIKLPYVGREFTVNGRRYSLTDAELSLTQKNVGAQQRAAFSELYDEFKDAPKTEETAAQLSKEMQKINNALEKEEHYLRLEARGVKFD